nr:MAG TPA: hypothetical protein [Caudoviricetes sp.]
MKICVIYPHTLTTIKYITQTFKIQYRSVIFLCENRTVTEQ